MEEYIKNIKSKIHDNSLNNNKKIICTIFRYANTNNFLVIYKREHYTLFLLNNTLDKLTIIHPKIMENNFNNFLKSLWGEGCFLTLVSKIDNFEDIQIISTTYILTLYYNKEFYITIK